MCMRRFLILTAVALLTGCASDASAPDVGFSAVQLGTNTQNPETLEVDGDSGGVSTDVGPADQPVESGSESAIDRYAEIEIEDQIGDGQSVLVDEIHISVGNCFLVFTDSTGAVIASTLVTTQSQPVVVKLESPVKQSQWIDAELHLDNGDGKFDPEQDVPLVDDEGEPVDEDFFYRLSQVDQ